MHTIQKWAAAGAAALCLVTALPMRAVGQTLTVTDAEMYGQTTAQIYLPGEIDETVYLGPVYLTTSEMGVLQVNCADWFSQITRGVQDPPLTYYLAPLTSDSAGHAISTTLAEQIGWLELQSEQASDAYWKNVFAGASWVKEYGGLGGTVTVSDPSMMADIMAYADGTSALSYVPYALTSRDGHQWFVSGLPEDVPEPASYALLLSGLVGVLAISSVRHRLRQNPTAV